MLFAGRRDALELLRLAAVRDQLRAHCGLHPESSLHPCSHHGHSSEDLLRHETGSRAFGSRRDSQRVERLRKTERLSQRHQRSVFDASEIAGETCLQAQLTVVRAAWVGQCCAQYSSAAIQRSMGAVAECRIGCQPQRLNVLLPFFDAFCKASPLKNASQPSLLPLTKNLSNPHAGRGRLRQRTDGLWPSH